MRDIAILTKYYKNYNYGGMLQGYALHKVISMLGYSVDLVSYDVRQNSNPVYVSLIQQCKQYGLRAAIYKAGEKAIGKCNFLISDLLETRIQKFNQFMIDANANTKLYNDDTILELGNEYKIFVSGSDQIWNPNSVRKLYLQTFINAPNRKISYAASIGRNTFTEHEADILIPYIRNFGTISVREETAKKLLENYIQNNIYTVIDPTMLLSLEDWDNIASKRLIIGKYAIVYFFSNNLAVRKASMDFCNRHGLQMVLIPYAKQEFNLTDGKGVGKRLKNIGPREFVSAIKHAEFVLTDSFHGVVFSIIYQKPFAVFERNKAGHVSMNSRLYDLLNTFDLTDRLIDIENIGLLDSLIEIDTEKVVKFLTQKKCESHTFLKESIDKAVRSVDNGTGK